MVVGIFLLTVILGLFSYLVAELPLWWQKLSSPAVISRFPEESFGSVVSQVEELVENLQGSYGFYVYQLETGEAYGFNQDRIFTAASLIKLPVMLAIFQEAEAGRLDLADYIADLEAMGRRSDNQTFSRTVNLLGRERIQVIIDELGMSQTSFENNDTTPQDIGLFFRQLYRGDLISDKNRDEFFKLLTDTIYEDRIPAGVPEGIRVAHMIATEINSFSDAGIVFADKPFVLVIMSDGARESEAGQVLPEITRVIWEHEDDAVATEYPR